MSSKRYVVRWYACGHAEVMKYGYAPLMSWEGSAVSHYDALRRAEKETPELTSEQTGEPVKVRRTVALAI